MKRIEKPLYIDFLGKQIYVGSEIVYPGRRGGQMWMNYGVVQQLGVNVRYDRVTARIAVLRTPMTTSEKERIVWIDTLNRTVVVG